MPVSKGLLYAGLRVCDSMASGLLNARGLNINDQEPYGYHPYWDSSFGYNSHVLPA